MIYAWDVVNEAVANKASEAQAGDTCLLRTKSNLFYDKLGPKYVKLSFEYARKYVDPSIKLFYNDYSTEQTWKREDICNLIDSINTDGKYVDGVSMQCYIGMTNSILSSYPNKDTVSISDAIIAFNSHGMEVHFTELTVRNNNPLKLGAHGQYYFNLFNLIKGINTNGSIETNVTIWGIVDMPYADPTSYAHKQFGIFSGIITDLYKPKSALLGITKALKNQSY